MEPFKVNKLPIDYNVDKELLSLISDANQKYGEYKSNLKNSKFDSKFFLDSIILSESLKLNQIEGTQISQDEMYYLKYMPKTDETSEIQNLKRVIDYSKSLIMNKDKLDIKKLNDMHRVLLDSVHGNNKGPGKIRNIQNWIGPKGCIIEEAIFVPPTPEEVPILFLSEVIELYKPSYHRYLNESRNGNMLGFIKFFLQCIIEQYNNYIAKINRIQKIYEKDMNLIESLNSNAIYRIMPAIMHQIVFTKKGNRR